MDALLIFILICIAVTLGLGFAGWKLHQYSLEKYSYSPFNIPHIVMAVVSCGTGIAGLYVSQFHVWDWIRRITTLSTMDGDWSALILFVIALILLVVFYVRSYQNTDHWIALSSLLILWSLATIVIVGLILLYVLQHKDKAKKQ